MKKEVKQNLITYGIFLLIAWVGIIYGRHIQHDYPFLRVWDYNNLLFLMLGVPFLFFQTRARLPEFWSNNVINKYRFLIPTIIGIVFGVIDVLIIKVMMHPEPYTELPPLSSTLPLFPLTLFFWRTGS